VNRLEYDKFDQRSFQEDGNGVRSQYAFDPTNRRLTGIQSAPNNGHLFQNTTYSYDNVGNLLGLANNIDIPNANQPGGPTSQTFGYDDLDRLTSASGTYQFAPDKSNVYSETLAYDSLHNLTAKHQTNSIIQPSSTPVTQHDTTYDYTYLYGGGQPHAPTHLGTRTFTYDANGNQSGWTDDGNGQRRTITWDEENRILALADNGHTINYTYDNTGERVIKRGPQGQTVYVNQYFTVRNDQIATLHVFVGQSRVVSKLMKPDTPGNPNKPFEKDQFFFHADQVSSTNYVTDTNGKIFQHLEYFPSGETWVEEDSNTQRTPFLFSGKELDEDTQLYYFGARYYDPKTGVWQSPDPALERRLQDLPEDASKSASNLDTASPSFLNLYNYADANPLGKVDPDGRQAVPLTTVQLRAIARSQGIGAGLSGVQFNRAVGRAFQEFALNSLGLVENFTPFPSPARAAATGGLPAAVIPDAVTAVKKVELRWYFWPTVTEYPNSSFYEVKAVAGVINLSYSNHQIRGLIDVAARSPAGMGVGPKRPLPIITFVTTADTVIGPDVLAEATRRGVAIWQSIAVAVPNGQGGTQIAFGPYIPLNPGVYGGTAALPAGGAPPGTIGPAHSGGPPGDPDPAEVQ
jgi:RHS repeat-associated protein